MTVRWVFLSLSVMVVAATGVITAQTTTTNAFGRRLWSTATLDGSASGSDFTRVIDVAIDGNGNVFVLDADPKTPRVQAIGRDGRSRGSLGTFGRGPCEFDYPQALIHDGKEHLYVLDRNNGLIVVRTAAQGTMTCETTRVLTVQGSDFCMMDSTFFVYGLRGTKTIHEIGRDGSVRRSFGDMFGPANDRGLQNMYSRIGRIGCSEYENTLFTAAGSLPYIFVYRRDGTTLWRDSLTAIRFQRSTTRPNPRGRGLMTVSPISGHDVIAVLRPLRAGTTLIQTVRMKGGAPLDTVGTCLLRTATRRCEDPTRDVPYLIAQRNELGVVLREGEIPVLELVELGAGALRTERR